VEIPVTSDGFLTPVGLALIRERCAREACDEQIDLAGWDLARVFMHQTLPCAVGHQRVGVCEETPFRPQVVRL
jgi:hypothetical protein